MMEKICLLKSIAHFKALQHKLSLHPDIATPEKPQICIGCPYLSRAFGVSIYAGGLDIDYNGLCQPSVAIPWVVQKSPETIPYMQLVLVDTLA